MAKIDTSKIEGYSDMTAEQKLEALEAYETPDPDYSGYVKKDLYDKAAHDAADWKKKHNALLSEDERKKAESDERWNQMQTRLEQLEGEKTVSGYVARFVQQGYPAELAQETAQALADGDMEKVFENQTAFMASYKENLKKEQLKNTPRPQAGGDPGAKKTTSAEYQKQAEEAMNKGNFSLAAYLTRLANEAEASDEE